MSDDFCRLSRHNSTVLRSLLKKARLSGKIYLDEHNSIFFCDSQTSLMHKESVRTCTHHHYLCDENRLFI